MTETTEAPATVTEVWAYAGRRVMSDGTIAYAWVDDEGRGSEHNFNRNPKAVIGYLYERQVIRANDTITVQGSPVIVGKSWSGAERIEDLRPEWFAKDNYAAQFVSRKRLQNAAAKETTDLDALIKPLLDVAVQLRNGAERDALTAYVIRRMHEVWYVRGKAGV